MRYVVTRHAVVRRVAVAAVVTMTLVLGAAPSYALTSNSGTTINVGICGTSGSTQLAISSPVANSTVSSVPVTIQGVVNRISQISVYRDGQYDGVIPLNTGATTFSYIATMTAGSHVFRFEGVDICQQTTPVAEITITYDQAVIITHPSTPGTASNPGTTTPVTGPGITEFLEGLPPIKIISDGFYKLLVWLDFASPTSFSSVPRMAQRFTGMTVGLALLFLARPLLDGYRYVRYVKLGWRARPLPLVLRSHPLVLLRISGLIIITIVILFLA
ncbi:membrane protein of unknown function [Candidatus Saccharimonas aalborgensis]|uniref:Bacterial Ig-like domain-containing protein n=1 Tax=Candidatus Saccharimonas aalborgensis TaxID=1332188 RepID=R4PVN7_9BACT|nr:hypothetical protein [Candidatus Saccharimonas aalborgensis]AGL62310.1 membrane protein of unknown function [Candidatus Saccharimonas aalborgensis]QQR51063.1 MAG: hypothetical protein IPF89_04855 [Candidatus Saccharibacteria bacterium]QQS68811.1 MAG: hypothetical protein IPP24_02175 [Candidatus Saccharibacteria bacterium]QQS71097.1 MAG: hypothetical protein IPP92_02310 [Candidatus Saccharibacteria bacterium]